MCSVGVVTLFLTLTEYSRINFTKSPVSGTGNVSKPKLMSQTWRVREVVSTQVNVFLHSERWW